MTRPAKLYLLSHKDWKHLAVEIENNTDYSLKSYVTIFQLNNLSVNIHYYAILSLSHKTDLIIETYGATLADEPNALRYALHPSLYEVLYGNKSNIVFLDKP
jgi:hypothetical protein